MTKVFDKRQKLEKVSKRKKESSLFGKVFKNWHSPFSNCSCVKEVACWNLDSLHLLAVILNVYQL
jgi:hypothetical protein